MKRSERGRGAKRLQLCPLNWILPGIICTSSSHRPTTNESLATGGMLHRMKEREKEDIVELGWGWGGTLKGLKKVKCVSAGVFALCAGVGRPGFVLWCLWAWRVTLPRDVVCQPDWLANIPASSHQPYQIQKGYTSGKNIDFYLAMVEWQEIIDYKSDWAVDSIRL